MTTRARSVALASAGIAAGLLVWLVLMAMLPTNGARADAASRLALGAASLLPAAGVLAAMTIVQMVFRFVAGAFDPTLGRDGRFLVVNQRVIANTVEQTAVFVPSMLALSAAAAPLHMPMVVATGWAFAGARLAFWIGYLADPVLRAPGMAATAAFNLAALLCAIWAWFA